MAIAYYIPDQAKLLARGRNSRENNNNNRNANANSTDQQRSESSEPNSAINRGYGTTINLTVPTYDTSQESAGCWDFLTQVFCHALRFYHESSQLQPTVIQISVNFQSQVGENPRATENSATSGNSTTTATATAQQNTTTDNSTSGNDNSSQPTSTSSVSTATSNAPTARLNHADRTPLKVKKSGKRKN